MLGDLNDTLPAGKSRDRTRTTFEIRPAGNILHGIYCETLIAAKAEIILGERLVCISIVGNQVSEFRVQSSEFRFRYPHSFAPIVPFERNSLLV